VPIAILFYDIVLSIHILAVVVAFGVVFAYPVIDAQIKRASLEQLPTLHRLHLVVGRRVISPAMIVVLIAGVYLATDRDLFGKVWVSVPLVIMFALFAITGAVLTPTDRKLAELAERDLAAGGGLSAEYDEHSARAALFGSIALGLVVVAIFFMTAKPGGY
jgi:small-conductance mechanosensitive channel